MKQVLLAGSTGFIGKNLLIKLSKRNDLKIRAVGHTREPQTFTNVETIIGDLRDPEFVQSAVKDIDVVIQFAATTSGAKDIINTPHLHVTDNAIMNSYLLKFSAEAGVNQFIFPSCTVMYQTSKEPLTENDFNPSDPIFPNYFGVGHTKLYIERMCQFFSSVSEMRTIALRHSNIYGPHDKFDLEKSHFVGASIRKVIEATDGTDISIWGDGKTGRDLLFVDDMVNAVESSMELDDLHSVYNVGSGKAHQVIDVIRSIISVSGKQLSISHDLSKPSINTSLAIDSSRFEAATGWKNQTSLEDGLRRTYKWAHQRYSRS